MEFNRGLIGGSTDMLILSLIEDVDMYGYEIIQELEKKSDGAFLFKEGTLYPILHKLEKDKYLKSYSKKGDRGRARKYYKITEIGKEFLKSELELWEKFKLAVSKTLVSNNLESIVEEKVIEKTKDIEEKIEEEEKVFRKGNILF